MTRVALLRTILSTVWTASSDIPPNLLSLTKRLPADEQNVRSVELGLIEVARQPFY